MSSRELTEDEWRDRQIRAVEWHHQQAERLKVELDFHRETARRVARMAHGYPEPPGPGGAA